MSTKSKLDNFIFKWNNENPLDYLWRKKYNIPFGSEQHKGITFLDQAIDLREEEIFKIMVKEIEAKKNVEENEIVGLSDDKRIVDMSKSNIDEEFENLDLKDYIPNSDNNNSSNLLSD